MDEFSLIEHFFKPLDCRRDDVLLGIGDDAACVHISQGMNLLVSTDTLVSGVHFLPQWNAYDIACKSVMANVSDMAAMAADPCWITLSLTLPEFNQQWLTLFVQGLKDSLRQFNMTLIGGDTTRGPLSITLTVFGTAPKDKAIPRSGAKPGDIIVVSGELGAAALAIKFLENQKISKEDNSELMNKLLHPKPRIDLVDFLRRYATAAIDISDGLSADLNHICVASKVGACLNEEAIPVHPLLDKYWSDKAVDLALTGGDDYELCFTVPEHRLASLMNECKEVHLHCYPVGVIEATPGLRVKDANNHCHVLKPAGYSHF
ncbi:MULTISPECIES: thiamine-phosphate kinase [Legionella]|uniref:Thiamine-monophosphate kinase n=1 Tax=Legionella resiliens TaxID=2905958 RepID=A0ABS8X4F9_9GAMM|nr:MULTISPECIES: thiamine-phosphate kinase [unclassified Legionella]MCE0723059.1 thiamine-phosphate kinase [Legionella sp. 9fVS26]MCE3532212.1 thiamine-phosphate kinase [Legionella sp. 8cVS16]QLZ68340.1 thiamine-phosphate kinase [Legionella sp. PC1000]